MPNDNAATRQEFCGDEQPHERHEWIDGMIRRDCPGAPDHADALADLACDRETISGG